MRDFGHWSWRYARDRSFLLAYEITHRGWPWLCPDANAYLANALETESTCFEWGSGRSTIWLAKRVNRLVSIEHDETWLNHVERRLGLLRSHGVELQRVSEEERPYVEPIDAFTQDSIDIVLVDGISKFRDSCALAALPKIRSGGIIMVDDIQRYLPSSSVSPGSIGPKSDPSTPAWSEFVHETADWNCHWFSSGVTDTAIWERP